MKKAIESLMSTKMKRTLFALALLMSNLLVSAQTMITVDGLKYQVDGSSASVVANRYTGKVVVPAQVSSGGTTYSVVAVDNDCFNGCDGLTAVELPASVKSLGKDGFGYCENLPEVTIPAGVTKIGEDCFEFCSSLKKIVCKATTPPAVDGDLCDEPGEVTLVVPVAAVNAYKGADGWKEFKVVGE